MTQTDRRTDEVTTPGFLHPSARPLWRTPGAVVAAAGALLVAISYGLVWYRPDVDASVAITGWGGASESGYDVDLSLLHLLPVLAVVLVVTIVVGLVCGRTIDETRPVAMVTVLSALSGALVSLAVVPDGISASGAGVYVAVVGCLVIAAGGALLTFVRR